jgi:hypothetical protein
MMEVNGADLGHAAGEERVADGGGEHDGEEDGVLGGAEGVLHLLSV